MNDWASAVRLLTRFRPEGPSADHAPALVWFPLVGGGIGLAFWALASLCVWLAGPWAGCVLAALLLGGAEAWLTGGRRYAAAIRLLERLPDAGAGTEAAAYLRLVAFQALVLVKLLGVAVLSATDRGAWLIVVGALSAGALASPTARGHQQASHDTPEWWLDWGHWLVAAGLAIVAGRLAGITLAALFSVAVAWVLPGVLATGLGREAGQVGSLAWVSVIEGLSVTLLAIGALAALAA